MRKRCLSILLVLALVLAYLPVPVHAAEIQVDDGTNYDTFAAAITAAADGDTIKLMSDIDIGTFNGGNSTYAYSIDLNGWTLSGTSFTSSAVWEIYDSSTGTDRGSFDVDTITLGSTGAPGSISAKADEGTFDFRAHTSVELIDDSMLWIGNGGSVDIGTITSAGDSAWVKFAGDGATGIVDSITLTGTGYPQVLFVNSNLQIGEIHVTDSINSTMELEASEIECGNLYWSSDNPIDLNNSKLTIITIANISYATDSGIESFSLDDKSKVVITGGSGAVTSEQTSWFAAYLNAHSPSYVDVTDEGTSIGVTFANHPIDGSARPAQIVLKNTFEIPHFSGIDPADLASQQSVFVMKKYSGSEQYLFPDESAAEIGGTVWYCLDTSAGSPVWTTTAPTATDVVEYPNAAYLIVGDEDHNDSAEIDCPAGSAVGIEPLEITVNITGNTDTVQYDGTEHTVVGYTATAGSDLYDVDSYLSYSKGTSTEPSVSGTGANTYAMGLQDDIDNNCFVNGNNNFTIASFNLTADGSLTIDPRPVEVIADDQNVLVGDAMPALTAQVTGAVTGEEDLITYTVSTTAADTSTEGSYPITPSGDATQGNYTVTYTDGLLTVGVLPEAAWTQEPAAASGLTYDGTAQELVTAGIVPEVCTALYSLDGATYDTAVPTGTDAGDYTVYYKVQGDGVNYWDSAAGSVSVSIDKASAAVTGKDLTVAAGEEVPALDGTFYTVEGVFGTDDLGTVTVEYRDGDDNALLASEIDTSAAGAYRIVPSITGINDNYLVTLTNGTLTITDGTPEAVWTAEPAAVNGLTYNGEAQELVTAGTVPAGCTALYSLDGTAYDTAIPAGTDAGEYTVYYRIQGDGVNYVDSSASGSLIANIGKASVTVQPVGKTMTAGSEVPDLSAAAEGTDYTVTGRYGTDELGTIELRYQTMEGADIAREEIDNTTAGTYRIVAAVTGTNGNYDVVTPAGTLTIEVQSGGGGPAKQEEASYDFSQPEEGVGAGVEDEKVWTWGDRANLAEDPATLYMVLSNNAISEEEDTPLPYPEIGTDHFLATDDIWTLPTADHEDRGYKIVSVQVCEDHEPKYFGNGDGKVDESSFGKSDFFTVGVGTGDMTIDYPNLTTGDVVTNKTFNGVFVTKLQKTNNPTFDADLAKLKSDAFASFRTFELDHPEVFWLTGDVKLRAMTVTISGVQTAYLFLVLVDDTGFTMRIPDYAAPGAIEAAIAQRDAAVAAIIAQIPAGATTREKITNLNKWFTLHNEYNRSADLNSIGYTPHRSLKALVGAEGTDGPVCDGYSRGFKTVCDRLGIPVILDTGVASRGSHSEFHMWMRIQVDGTWYGMDCTWNDPVMEGVSGKISGYENEQYLLVGDDTVVEGQKFGISHPVNTAAGGTTGVLFASLMVSTGEIDGYMPLDFEDVRLADWFYDYVKSAASLGLMGGVADRVFSPQTNATRGQIVQILYNAAGQPAVGEVKVDGWFGKAATWAMEKGIVAGYADGQFHGSDSVTREQLATILWAYEGAAAQEGELDFADAAKVSDYAVQALLWAKKEGIIGGKPGNLADPQGTATRAEIATIFSNYMK